jgi:protein transport protein YIF1
VQQQQQPQVNSYGNPYQQSPPGQGGGMPNAFGNNFGGFMNDPTAQMGFQVGKSAVMAGQHYMEQNVNRYISVPALKHYFNVSNSYVVRKLLLVLVPWRHKPWTRSQSRMTTSSTDPSGQMGQEQYSFNYLPPRDDLNSPDMYIPIMAFITYILLSTVLAGIRGSFRPELLGSTASTAMGVVIFEIVILKIAMYLLSISNESQLLDLVAYSGYKFVGVIITLFFAEILTGGQGTNNWVGWVFFLYTWYANAFFLVSQ